MHCGRDCACLVTNIAKMQFYLKHECILSLFFLSKFTKTEPKTEINS